MKRLFALLLCLCLCLSLIPAAAAEDIEIVEIEPENEEIITLVGPEETLGEATTNAKPTITASPKSVTAYVGTTAKFTVEATGAESWQWYYRTSAEGSWAKSTATGAKTATLSVVAETFRSGYQYYCKVRNADGTSYTKVATLTVTEKPLITSQPTDKAAEAGTTVKFTVKATGADSYQWYYRTSEAGSWAKSTAASAKTATLSIEAASKRDGYQYRCKLTNAKGSVYSEAATLTVGVMPTVTTQPLSYTAGVGATIYFKVKATDAESYQWYYRTGSSGSWKSTSLTGNKTATMTVKATEARDGYQYRCKVTNAVGSKYSKAATLTVYTEQCGENLTWKLSSSGLLTISGKGEMYDFWYDTDYTPRPWDIISKQVERITIGNGVTSIGNYAFDSCTYLTSVTIPNSVTSIGDYAFESCESLASITIPDSVTSIGKRAFGECRSISDVIIGNRVRIIGDHAFAQCDSLTSITIPNGVITIGDYTFFSDICLKEVIIPDSVTSIGENAFYCCFSLTSVTIPNSVTSIADYAFSGCNGLTSVSIGKGVISVGIFAFEECGSITDVYYRGTKTQWGKIKIRTGNDDLLNATIHYNA